MQSVTGRPSRRSLLRAGVAGAVGAAFGTGCSARFADVELRVGAGFSQGVYYALAGALADAWQIRLGLRKRPVVRQTAGSVENLQLLASGQVDVVFATADVTDNALGNPSPPGRAPRALGRIYDDALQVVVPAESSATRLADLRGHRVSIGASDSGVIVAAKRLLEVAGVDEQHDLRATMLGLDASVAAMKAGQIDAFFWSGGLPTGGLTALAEVRPIRLLDLGPVVTALHQRYPVYDAGVAPATTYRIPSPTTIVLVRNFLLVASEMPDDMADEMVAAIFAERDRLVRANPAARAIDPRAAISTQPIPLHPGAERYYRAAKD